MTVYSSNCLESQVAVVTGGSRGIGRAISLMLASMGAEVCINYARNAQAAEEVVEQITSSGGSAWSLPFDVSSQESVDEGFKQIFERHKVVNILVNNAGIAVDGLLVRTSADDWHRVLETNLSSLFYCSKAVARKMLKARGGRIVNISSVIGQSGNTGQLAYAASKSGVLGFTKSLAKELGSRGITVNSVCPGYIETDMTAEFSPEQAEALLSQIPVGRLGSADDVASLVAFLASPGAGYITGQTIGINGGLHM